MSSIPSLRCLFCQHLNPAGAVFCNDCGGQLNLQPCERCGAIDSRTATNCYKCGAEFPVPVAPEPDALPAPAIPDKEPSYASPEPQAVDEVLSSETAATAAPSRRRLHVAVLAFLLVVASAVVSVYLYEGQQARQQGENPGQKQAVTGLPSAPSAQATDTVRKPAAGTMEPENTPSPAPPGADVARTARPLPATDAEVKARQDSPIVEKCPPAVATLGLCNPEIPQEKH